MVLTKGKALSFDDIVLLPQYSDIDTRKNVSLKSKFFDFDVEHPIISSNMDSITGFEMARAMYKAGGLGFLHRYKSKETILNWIKNLRICGALAIPSIGVKESEFDVALEYLDNGANAICIDVAHGDHQMVFNLVSKLKTRSNANIIGGNVVTYEAAKRLYEAGCSTVRVGIGNGSLCSTRIVTGHGLPQITALMNVSHLKTYYSDFKIICDGGIRHSGDCVKAFAVGADFIMGGSLFAGCDETPILENGKRGYRGMASREARQAFYGATYKQIPEGEAAREVNPKGPVKNVVDELVLGIKSGLSYSGALDIPALQRRAILYEVSHAGYIEGTPHFKLTYEAK